MASAADCSLYPYTGVSATTSQSALGCEVTAVPFLATLRDRSTHCLDAAFYDEL
jgi:hypothetical protein